MSGDSNLGEITVNVSAEGADAAGRDAEDAAEGVDGGAGDGGDGGGGGGGEETATDDGEDVALTGIEELDNALTPLTSAVGDLLGMDRLTPGGDGESETGGDGGDGDGDGGTDTGGDGGDADGDGEAGGGLPGMDELAGALAPLAFLSILASLKPIQAALQSVLGIFEALLAPFLLLGLRLLSPVLQALIKALPMLMNFLDDPVGSLIGLGEFITDVLTDLPSMIWEFIQRLPGLIKDQLEGLFDFLDQSVSDALSEVTGVDEESVVSPTSDPGVFGGPALPLPIFRALGAGATATTTATTGGGTGERIVNNINFTGGLSAFVERVNRDDNFDFLP